MLEACSTLVLSCIGLQERNARSWVLPLYTFCRRPSIIDNLFLSTQQDLSS